MKEKSICQLSGTSGSDRNLRISPPVPQIFPLFRKSLCVSNLFGCFLGSLTLAETCGSVHATPFSLYPLILRWFRWIDMERATGCAHPFVLMKWPEGVCKASYNCQERTKEQDSVQETTHNSCHHILDKILHLSP